MLQVGLIAVGLFEIARPEQRPLRASEQQHIGARLLAACGSPDLEKEVRFRSRFLLDYLERVGICSLKTLKLDKEVSRKRGRSPARVR